ncbi:MAG: hypothetical protein AAF721_06390 [Myxococcota bacterium]
MHAATMGMRTTTLCVAMGLVACGGDQRDTVEQPPAADGTTSGGDDGGDDGGPDTGLDTGEKLDIGGGSDDGPAPTGCAGDEECELIDVLFVIDNSGTMGEEQLNLSRNFPLLVDRLENLKKPGGGNVNADVNIMVTTSDFGHPLCTDFQPVGYAPGQGRPVFTGCNARIDSFTSVHPFNPTEIPEACTEGCPMDIVPGGDPFIHFDSASSNVVFNDISGALSCMAPQGINGCGYEAPLETMLHALRPEACWNQPEGEHCEDDPEFGWVGRGFIRRGSTLAIAIITDEADCSVASPDGFAYFTQTDRQEYWLEDPNIESLAPSSAVCWRAGVDCVDDDDDGVYESCTANDDNPVLHPTQRYKDFLAYLEEEIEVEVVMLGVLGIPPVTAHNEEAPFEPTEGGVFDLEYRDWRDGVYDGTEKGGDILPADWNSGLNAAHKQWEFGVGPGCTGITTVTDKKTGEESEVFTGQAIPPVRIREVCESLNKTDADGNVRLRCCMESICDDDFSDAIDCLTGIIEETLIPVG